MVFIYGDLLFDTQIYVNNIYYYLNSIHFLLPFYLLVLIPAFTQALLRLEWRPFITFLMISLTLIIFCHFLKPVDNLAYQLGIWISVLMLCHKEYQKSFYAIYFDESKTCSESSRAWANYTFPILSNIQDVILKTSIIGNFLDYGTVVPLTASGIGTGQSTSTAAVHTALGSRVRVGLGGAESKGQTTANSSPEYALVCIPKARQAYKMILEVVMLRLIEKINYPKLEETPDLHVLLGL